MGEKETSSGERERERRKKEKKKEGDKGRKWETKKERKKEVGRGKNKERKREREKEGSKRVKERDWDRREIGIEGRTGEAEVVVEELAVVNGGVHFCNGYECELSLL